MNISFGELLYVFGPIVMAGILLWRYPSCRKTRLRSLVLYAVSMSLLIGGALRIVAYIATATVRYREVLVVLWFTIAWRLAWSLWTRTVGRWGQRWVRWARQRRRHGQNTPFLIRLIPVGRAMLTATIFIPLFLSTVLTHRCKLGDDQNPLEVFQAKYEHVRIPTADDVMLDGWYIPEKDADRTIIICHGAGANKGNFLWFLGPLMYRGYNVVFFDFRAHGGSDGRTTSYGVRERVDVQAVVDWLKRERPDESRKIVGLGSSQGAMALALAAAVDTRIDVVVLDSPFISPREQAMYHARRLPVVGPLVVNLLLFEMSMQIGPDFLTASAEQAVASMGRRPVLVIHGDEDVIMPASHAQRLYDAARGPREIWFGPGPHSNIITTDPSGYAERLFRFLDNNLGPVNFKSLRRRDAQSRPTGSQRE